MTTIPYKEPSFKESSFNCPLCNAFANQSWLEGHYYGKMGYAAIGDEPDTETWFCACGHCHDYSIWRHETMIYPDFSTTEPPNDDLGDEIKSDYREAASILQKSPRGSAALLRLAIQRLCQQLGEKGKDLNVDIANLVKKGLPLKVQQSLDALRVIGNESVHPGQIDLRDDPKIAQALFRLVNFIAEKMVTELNEIDSIYSKIPEEKKKQIKKRDDVKG